MTNNCSCSMYLYANTFGDYNVSKTRLEEIIYEIIICMISS